MYQLYRNNEVPVHRVVKDDLVVYFRRTFLWPGTNQIKIELVSCVWRSYIAGRDIDLWYNNLLLSWEAFVYTFIVN